MIEAMTGTVSFDLETTGLYPWDEGAQIVSMGVGTGEGEYLVPMYHNQSPWSDEDLARIIDRMSDQIAECITIAHNGKFDQLWVYVHYQQMWRVDFDTMLAHYIVDENARHGISTCEHMPSAPNFWDAAILQKNKEARQYEKIN